MDILLFVLVFAIAILTLAGMWKTFEKAGESGWKALIPVYNLYIIIRISGHSGWWLIVFFLPVLVILTIIAILSGTSEQLSGGLETLADDSAFNSMGYSISFAIQLLALSIQAIAITGSVITYNFCRSFGKGLPFTIGLALLGFVFWPILGFGRAVYQGPVVSEGKVRTSSQDDTVSSDEQVGSADVDQQ